MVRLYYGLYTFVFVCLISLFCLSNARADYSTYHQTVFSGQNAVSVDFTDQNDKPGYDALIAYVANGPSGRGLYVADFDYLAVYNETLMLSIGQLDAIAPVGTDEYHVIDLEHLSGNRMSFTVVFAGALCAPNNAVRYTFYDNGTLVSGPTADGCKSYKVDLVSYIDGFTVYVFQIVSWFGDIERRTSGGAFIASTGLSGTSPSALMADDGQSYLVYYINGGNLVGDLVQVE